MQTTIKKTILIFLLSTIYVGFSQEVLTADIAHFWEAYDQIVLEKDSLKQLELVKTLYINKGTAGLEGIMRARRYSAEEYVYAINHYPKFWTSVRSNTLKAISFRKKFSKAYKKLKTIYPDLKPVNIYFEIGILRTGGTTIDGMSLIGSEVALTDTNTITAEFDTRYPHLRTYFNTNPIKDVVFNNVHEYIHAQQKETIGNTLLAQTVMEGVAEFLAEIACKRNLLIRKLNLAIKMKQKSKLNMRKKCFRLMCITGFGTILIIRSV